MVIFLSAYCKNSVDGQWYCFDDSDVQQLSENEVCKQTAYILFYQRRTAIPSWSAIKGILKCELFVAFWSSQASFLLVRLEEDVLHE